MIGAAIITDFEPSVFSILELARGTQHQIEAAAVAAVLHFAGQTPATRLMRRIEAAVHAECGVLASAAYAGKTIRVGVAAPCPFWIVLSDLPEDQAR